MVQDLENGTSVINDDQFPITNQIYDSISGALGIIHRQDDIDMILWYNESHLDPLIQINSPDYFLSGRIANMSIVPRSIEGVDLIEYRRDYYRLYLDYWIRYPIYNWRLLQPQGYQAILQFKTVDNNFLQNYNSLSSRILSEVNLLNSSQFDDCTVEQLQPNYQDWYEIRVEIQNEDQYINPRNWNEETVILSGELILKYITRTYFGTGERPDNVLKLHFDLTW